MKFDDVHGRFVGLVEAGSNLAEAAGRVGVAERTVHTWLARGRRESGTKYAAFAGEIDALLQGAAHERLSDEDLVRLLERSARKGSVRAIQLLLERPWEKNADDDQGERPGSIIDELVRRRGSAARTNGDQRTEAPQNRGRTDER